MNDFNVSEIRHLYCCPANIRCRRRIVSTFQLMQRRHGEPADAGSPPDAPALSLRAHCARFLDDTAGEIAMFFGLMALVLFMFIGLAVDFGRWINARDLTVSATDAAVLAAGRALQTNGGNQAAAIAIARKYYQQAVANRLKVKSDNIDFAVVDNGTAVKSTGQAFIATPFMSIGGVSQLQLLRSSGADYSKAVLAVGGNAETNIEISMMLDVSGSMGSGSKLADMKAAAKDLVEIVVWPNQSQYTSKIALVPFSGDVRPPSSILTQVTNSALPSTVKKTSGGRSYTYRKTVCVAERPGTNKYTDAAATSSGNYVLRQYTSDGNCAIHSNATVVPMTNDKATLKTKIDALVAQGMTAGQVGTAWAYYMLSPKWSTVLPSASVPVAYNSTDTKKIAVLMTDGEYNSEHDSSGITVGQNGAGSSVNGTSSSNQAREICTQMKNNGIEVYTVGFDLGGNQTAINTLSYCATDSSHFYNTSSGEALKQAFRDIALKISSLYLAE